MLGIHDFSLFVATAVLLNITPGPDTMYILGRSLAQGRRSGIASVFGISVGCLVHTIAAALGLSAILLTSALAFSFIKYLGAAYLIYLGVKMLLLRPDPARLQLGEADLWKIFRQGVLTNVLNPKVALFFLALLPQFVDKDAAYPAVSFLLLGLTFIFTGTAWCLFLACFAAYVSKRIDGDPRFSLWIQRASGLLFVGLGLRLALAQNRT